MNQWQLRQTAESRGYPVSGKQFDSFVEYGLLPASPDGTWPKSAVDRLIEIRKAKDCADSYSRRTLLLRRSAEQEWHTPPELLRKAMAETIASSSFEPVQTKMRRLYRAVLIEFGTVSLAQARRRPLPADWRLPDRPLRADVFSWPSDTNDFDQLADVAYHQARALVGNPRVQASGFLEGIPYEEIVLILMHRQLTMAATMNQFPEGVAIKSD